MQARWVGAGLDKAEKWLKEGGNAAGSSVGSVEGASETAKPEVKAEPFSDAEKKAAKVTSWLDGFAGVKTSHQEVLQIQADLRMLHPLASASKYLKGAMCDDIIAVVGRCQKTSKMLERIMAGEQIERKEVPKLLQGIDGINTKFEEIKTFCNRMLGDKKSARGRKRTAAAVA